MCRDVDEKEDAVRELGVTHMVETSAHAASALDGVVPHVYLLGRLVGAACGLYTDRLVAPSTFPSSAARCARRSSNSGLG